MERACRELVKGRKMTTENSSQQAGVRITPTTNLEALTDEQLLNYARGTYTAEAEATIRNHRAESGRILTELFRRYEKRKAEGEQHQTWNEICQSIPIARKTALNLRDGHATVIAADAIILAAAAERKIDLFQPSTNKILHTINTQQAGKPVTPEQLDAYLLQLDPPEPSDEEKAERKADSQRKKHDDDAARVDELKKWLLATGAEENVTALLDLLRPVITGFIAAHRQYTSRAVGETLALLAVGDIKPKPKAKRHDDDLIEGTI